MHYADIATGIQKRGLRSKVGATPAATVNVVIHDSIKKEGVGSPFVKVGTGEFILKSTFPQVHKAPSGHTAAAANEEAAAEEAAETGGIIKAFGMFWRRDWVDWTTRPVLFGQQQEGRLTRHTSRFDNSILRFTLGRNGMSSGVCVK
jgi:hypothetical protein